MKKILIVFLMLLGCSAEGSAATTFHANDAAVTYIGRWQQIDISGSHAMVSVVNGGRVRFKFSGTSLGLSYDRITSSSEYPAIEWSIDGGVYSRVTLSSTSTATLASSLSPGDHTADIWIAGISQGDTKWTNYMGVRLKQIVLDDNAYLLSWHNPSPKMLVIGDSIAAGQLALGVTSDSVTSADARHAFHQIAGAYLGYEVTVQASGGTGFCSTWASAAYPQTQDAYLYSMSTYTRNDPRFDLVLIESINNDTCSGSTLQGYIGTLIDRIRADQPYAKIYMMGRLYPGPADDSDVQAACTAKSINYISPAGWSYTHPNLNHPDSAGHASIAVYLEAILPPAAWKVENLGTGGMLGNIGVAGAVGGMQ